MDAQRALLDELMGSTRNLTEDERRGYKEVKWDDKEVCAYYILRFCSHDLFVNTKSDLGPCTKIHEAKLKESFENSPRHDSYVHKFEAELAHYSEKSEQSSVLEEKIRNLLEQVESLGEAGKVDEAEALMRKVEMLNVEKTALTQQSQQISALMIAQEKKMVLCETCDFLSEYKAAKEKAREEERLAREKEAEERKKLREKEYDSRRRRSVSSDRDKHKDRDYDRERDCH
ncbi:hypothetical protein K7X08_020202 [Anisodus acutangulus]|uniref:Luc7-like protein 3 n=1 Tax=Anisodus acutangulus TaxID=402998 RepID=A0A9Q1M915_9SOLA|nr:hypothetical protein K7X08_020202 [Anisodus acutangulus]